MTASAQTGPGVVERVRFGRDIPADVNVLLQQAAASTNDFNTAERALLAARALAPEQLEVLIALYKLYFYRGFTDAAEQVVLEALSTAADSDPGSTTEPPDGPSWRAVPSANPPRARCPAHSSGMRVAHGVFATDDGSDLGWPQTDPSPKAIGCPVIPYPELNYTSDPTAPDSLLTSGEP